MTIGVVIPSKSNSDGLRDLLDDIEEHYVSGLEVVVIDNGYEFFSDSQLPSYVTVIRDETPSIYALWNNGLFYLWELSCSQVVFLNDDVRLIGANWLNRLVEPLGDDVWVTCPDWTGNQVEDIRRVKGTYRHGGMCGFAFAVDAYACLESGALPFDGQYSWWYGDDAFALTVEAAGGSIARIRNIHVGHQESTTINKEDVAAAIGRDTARFRSIWGKKR